VGSNSYSKLVVAAVICLNVAFAAVALDINANGYDVSPSLIVSWFAFTGTELVAMAGIKVTKIRHEDAPTDNDTDNRDGVKGPRQAPLEEDESEDEDI